MKSKKKILEKDIEKKVYTYLKENLQPVLITKVDRNNLKAGKNNQLREAGISDLLIVTKTNIFWIEIKSNRGQIKEDQKEFAKKIQKCKNHYFILYREKPFQKRIRENLEKENIIVISTPEDLLSYIQQKRGNDNDCN